MSRGARGERSPVTALPGPDNTRIAYVQTGGGISETWHAPDCPALAIMQINFEEGSKRGREQDAWARGVFPAAYERRRKATAAMPAAPVTRQRSPELSSLVSPRGWAVLLVPVGATVPLAASRLSA
ncbi:hypothetical protein ACFU6I_47230 [Streptomyces sp. NPDC057486]|uniref:hypothetical protein n=1 Tax=Streptomyces sp. NPDC057486 TaxID=3346145 RepID=UPI0036AC4AE5